MQILTFFREILSTPAVLIATVTLLGLCLQKKSIDLIIKGTITSIIGYTLLSVGSSVLQNGALNDFGVLFSYDFHIQGVVPNMEAVASLGIAQYGALVSWVMLVGMVANIILARFSNFHYIFLTGHHTLYMACLLTVVLAQGTMMEWQIILSGGLLLGLTMSIMPSLLQKDMKKVVKHDKIAYGHYSTIGCLLASKIAKLVGDENKESKDIELHARLGFMKDSNVCIFIVMSIVFLFVTGLAVTRTDLSQLKISYSSSTYPNWIVYAITQAAMFTASIYIILAGVRLMVAEMVPAFKGIAKKLVPNAKPAVDCPIVFPYAPNAVMLGFLMSFMGGIVAMLFLIACNQSMSKTIFPIIVPGVVSHFFCGGSAGVFANAQGGTKGCIWGSFIHGIFITFLALMIMPMLGSLNLSGTTFSDTDFCMVGVLIGYLGSFISSNVLFSLSIILFIIPIVYKRWSERNALK